MLEQQQQTIINWFDKTYKSKGFSYLRPPEAYLSFVEILDLKPEDSVVDIACGPGLFLKLAYEKGCQCSGIDASKLAIQMAKSYVPKSDVRKSNAENLPFPDNSFDVVVCLGALERFINLDVALSQLLRVAKNNALFCFLVRNSNSLFWQLGVRIMKRQNLVGHQDAKTLEEWQDIYVSSGFHIKKIIPDQWPLQKFFSILPLTLRKKFLPSIHNGIMPLRFAGEFIFLLSIESSS